MEVRFLRMPFINIFHVKSLTQKKKKSRFSKQKLKIKHVTLTAHQIGNISHTEKITNNSRGICTKSIH